MTQAIFIWSLPQKLKQVYVTCLKLFLSGNSLDVVFCYPYSHLLYDDFTFCTPPLAILSGNTSKHSFVARENGRKHQQNCVQVEFHCLSSVLS